MAAPPGVDGTPNYDLTERWLVADKDYFMDGGKELSVIQHLHLEAGPTKSSLQRLSPAECAQQYSHGNQGQLGNVLVITTGASPNASIPYGVIYNDPVFGSELYWPCMGQLVHAIAGDLQVANQWEAPATAGFAIDMSKSCSLKDVENGQAKWQLLPDFASMTEDTQLLARWHNNTEGDISDVEVDHCLIEETVPSCTIRMSRSILIFVILANATKLICFISVITWANDRPLVTVGDGIASFLSIPDETTRSKGALSLLDVRENHWRPGLAHYSRPARFPRRFWYRSASWKRWLVTSFILFSLWIFALVLCYFASTSNALSQSWSIGFGNVSASFIINTARSSLTSNVILANVPQLFLSLCYVFYNNILTSMLLGAEYADYAHYRKPLRVSSGSDSQRSTYWLQIPYRYAMPLLVSFTVLHWVMSQSIFLANIEEKSATDYSILETAINACGYSPIAIIIAVAISGLLLLVLYGLGLRRYPSGMPLVGSCSVAISAACHAGEEEGSDMTQWPLMYGVLQHNGTRSKTYTQSSVNLIRTVKAVIRGKKDNPDDEVEEHRFLRGRRSTDDSEISETPSESTGKQYLRVGFSSWEVEPLVDGEIYR